MKKGLLLLLLLPVACFAQQLPPSRNDTLLKQELTRKVKWQKTVVQATALPGVALILVGVLSFISQHNEFYGLTYNGTSEASKTLAWIGGGLLVASLPFELAYTRNKNALASLTVQNQPSPLFNRSFALAIALRISIGK